MKSPILSLCLLVLGAAPALAGETLRVGSYENPPKVFQDPDGRTRGLFPDILEAVAEREGWRIEYVHAPWAECLALLEKGSLDVMVDVAWSEERARRFDFNELTVLVNWALFYAPEGREISSLLDLDGKRVAVLKGDISYAAFRDTAERFRLSCDFVEVDAFEDVFRALQAGDADAGLMSRLLGYRLERSYDVERTPIVICPADLRFAFPKGAHPGIIRALDSRLAEMKKDETSPYHRALDRWLGGSRGTSLPAWLAPVLAAGAGLLALAFLVAAVFRMQVRARTRDLARKNEELRKVNRALRTLSRSNTALLTAEKEEDLLEEVCSLAIHVGEYRRVWIGLAGEDGPDRLEPAASSGFPDDSEALKGFPWSADVPDPVRRALETRRVAVLDRLPERPLPGTWKKDVADSGLASLIALPLAAGDDLLGVLAIFSSDSEAFAPGEVSLLEEMAADLAFGLSTLRMRRRHEQGEEARERLRSQLLLAQKMEAVGRLAGGVAHDFNNMMTVVTGYSALALERMGEGHPARLDIEEIRRAGERATDLTRQLLAFSRKQVLKPRVLDLSRVVRGMEKMLRRLIGEDVELALELADDLGSVKADPGQMEQIVMNLAVNARDAMPQGGRIAVRTANADPEGLSAAARDALGDRPCVRLEMCDDGVGMDEDTVARVFEPFFTTKGKDEGTGLGLSTVYGIVSQSGGHIEVDSEPGKGTCFRILFPRMDEAGEEEDEAPGARGELRGSETVLLVEDEPAVRSAAIAMLRSYGYGVLEAASGSQALDLFRQDPGRVHLLLTDVIMPDRSGSALAREVRVLAPDLPVLFMSGYTDDAIARHGVLEEGIHFLEKPFSPAELAAKVREVLDAAREA